MKKWVRKHPYLALTVGYIFLFVFGTGIWLVTRHDLAYALTTSFAWTLIYGLFAVFQVRRRIKAKARLEDHGQVMIYLRYPDSRPGSLNGIWNQGIATPSPRALQFQPAVYDTLEPSGRSTTINIQELLPDRRKLNGNDRKYIPAYGLRAMALMTDKGNVEIAATSESLDKLSVVLTRF
ncbi:hypothetical protein AL755_03480 (plasmid) [Arthrobacter sp. ERGS1:01]|uniref:hypothetical protein n=1 Tax=Arthrobacter sp. ERGS1:01 TaxID=1704044 RepID=UPI0006B5E549|nr:hypothetical protein [Arthrobacter sp. ERGS1:01]ALE04761.1 hypothetical protein AL755_03480 [Arthrobacter sp. ERGS1:01]